MKSNKEITEYDRLHDEDLRTKIKEEYHCINKEQYIFSKQLLKLQIEEGKTDTDLVKLTGISKSTISAYTNGKRKASQAHLKKLSKALMVPTDYFLEETNCKTMPSLEMNKILGMSENAMRSFFMVNHNVEECGDLTDDIEVSDVHKNKLDIFSLFISDIPNFIEILSYLERYVEVKQKINKDDTNNELDKLDKESLNNDLIGIEGRIIKTMFKSLDNIVDLKEKEV